MSILDLSRYDILTELKPYTQIGVIGLGCGEDLEFFARVRKRKRFTGFCRKHFTRSL
ncbi:MAG: hypothetical protein HY363_00710 [Candidatus Aenigmarchaeota archaeon]|nr:hypothetical protein [Candidatus Aenigmarchaeota archaeon]